MGWNRKTIIVLVLVLMSLVGLFIVGIYVLTNMPASPKLDRKHQDLPSAKSFLIGVSLGLTGKYAEPAAMHRMAYHLWEKEVNEKGGFSGRKVEVLIRDDKSDVNEALEAYRSLMFEERVDLLFGPYSSDILEAVAPVVDKFGYPMLSPGAAADSIWEQGYKNIFSICPPASRYATGILQLANLSDLKKVGIVYADDKFSTQVAKGARKWAIQLGLGIMMYKEFKKGTEDLVPLAREVRDKGTELLLICGHFRESIDMRRALKQINWYPRAFFATVGPALQKYQKTFGTDAELTFSTSIWEPHASNNFPRVKKFIASFRDHYHHEPSYHAAEAYAAGQILEAAIKLAGNLEREKIRQALYALNTECIIGRYIVDKTGKQKKWFPLTIQWQSGKKVIVWPKEDVRWVPPIFK